MAETDELDRRVRSGLRETGAGDRSPLSPTELAAALTSRRRRRRRQRAVQRVVMVAAAVLLSSIAVAAWPRSEGAYVESGAGPVPPVDHVLDLATLTPGWHPVPTPASAADGVADWNGQKLFIGGSAEIHAFDPSAGTWQTLPAPPFDGALGYRFVASADSVIAVQSTVSGQAGAAATAELDLVDGEWTRLADVPLATPLATYGTTGPGGTGALVLAGGHVFDMTHGAVLDLDAGDGVWRSIPFPSDLLPYTGLISTTPVWDEDEVLLASWSVTGGLAWSADGSSVRDLPGMPAEVHGRPGFNGDAAATWTGEELVLVTDGGAAAALDTEAGTWRSLPAIPGMPTSEGCPDDIATIRGVVVVSTCFGKDVAVHLGDGWTSTGAPPARARFGAWLDAKDVLFVWAATTDTANDPDAPYSALYAYVPPS